MYIDKGLNKIFHLKKKLYNKLEHIYHIFKNLVWTVFLCRASPVYNKCTTARPNVV